MFKCDENLLIKRDRWNETTRMPRFSKRGGKVGACCKVDIRTTGKDISQLKRKLKYIMGYPRIYGKIFHRWVKKR